MDCVPKPLRLREIAAENVELFQPQAEKKLISLRNEVLEQASAYADESMVSTVFRNLISNAIKFTAAGGSVTIASGSQRDGFIEIIIADTGVGIPAEMLPRLLKLDAQYTHIGTAGEEGTGLGLILCRELVEQNGGKIWVESQPGKGTTFHFTLPCPE